MFSQFISDSESFAKRLQALKTHRAAHSMGFDCGCGETDTDGMPYATLQDEFEQLLKDIDAHHERQHAEIVDLYKHFCSYDDEDICQVCGADGRA